MQQTINKIINNIRNLGYRTHAYPLPIGLTEEEQRVIAKYALSSRADGIFMETGTFFGGSSCILWYCAFENKIPIVVSIDPFQVKPIDRGLGSVQNFNNMVKKVGSDSIARLCNMESQKSREWYKENVDQPISFFFIDGDHRYVGCKGDFDYYKDLLLPGAYVAFHDCNNPFKDDFRTEEEVIKQNNTYDLDIAVRNLLKESPSFKVVDMTHNGSSIVVIQKDIQGATK